MLLWEERPRRRFKLNKKAEIIWECIGDSKFKGV